MLNLKETKLNDGKAQCKTQNPNPSFFQSSPSLFLILYVIAQQLWLYISGAVPLNVFCPALFIVIPEDSIKYRRCRVSCL